jgi:putative FmdB family regulatory protein
MPTYEYRCENCGMTIEVVQGFHDDPLTTCDSCGGSLRKVYAPVGIVFKGSGFYKTDSRGSGSSRSTVPSPKDPPKESSSDAPKEAPKTTDAGSSASEKTTKPAPTTSGTTPAA